MREHDVKFNYDDITVIPAVQTDIRSRKECNCYTEEGMLPIWCSPMDTVIGLDNWETFYDNKINVVIPRTIGYGERIRLLIGTAEKGRRHPFVAFSLDEAKNIPRLVVLEGFKKEFSVKNPIRVCIDMANGHMVDAINTVKEIKDVYGDNSLVMAGNIANPKTYELYENAGCDYLRVGIGGGSACLTSSNGGIHYPYFSLIKEIYEEKERLRGKCKIIADGGIRGFGDIQKALIYADAVMIGGLFNKAIESSAKTTYGNCFFNIRGKKIVRPIKTLLMYGREVRKADYSWVVDLIKKNKLSVWKEFYGMSTKKAQANIINAKARTGDEPRRAFKTSEGLVKYQKVEYSIAGWVRNEIDYLRSAMSYTNSRTLEEYKNSEWYPTNQLKYNK